MAILAYILTNICIFILTAFHGRQSAMYKFVEQSWPAPGKLTSDLSLCPPAEVNPSDLTREGKNFPLIHQEGGVSVYHILNLN